MGESIEQLERNLAAERQNLGRNLQELENKAHALTDWRTYYREHPTAVVGAAFGGALILGLLSRSRSRAPMVEQHNGKNNAQGADAGFRVPSPVAASVDRVKRQTAETWDHIAEALLGVATAKAIDFVSSRIPGFNEEYSKRHVDSVARRG